MLQWNLPYFQKFPERISTLQQSPWVQALFCNVFSTGGGSVGWGRKQREASLFFSFLGRDG